MNTKQFILNIPERIYEELDKLPKSRIEKYLAGLAEKIFPKPQKTSINKIFDLFKSKSSFSVDHDKYLYK